MRKQVFLALSVVAMLTALVGCSYDDGAIWDKFNELEEEIDQNREDIETLTALMDALSAGKVIISTETTDEGAVLTFSDGSKVTIRNGANGKDGADGEDGKDGADGKDGVDGADGKDGIDGANGADGMDGKDGDSFFQSVTQDEQFVYFTLADGTVITLPKGAALDITFAESDLVVRASTASTDIFIS